MQTLEDAETTAEVANSLQDLKKADKKNIKMASKKMQDKYKKVKQKRKATVPIEMLHKETEQKLTRNMEDAKKGFNQLKMDPQSVAFAEELLNKRLLVRLKNQNIQKTNYFLKLQTI